MAFELMKKFNKYLIDPDELDIDGLDLNWDHGFESCVEDYPFPNFGIFQLYSIGHTGHDYVVAIPTPNLKPEEYPIAIYGEEEGVSYIISASIKTWFPSYIVYTLNNLLSHYWYGLSQGSPSEYIIEELESFLNGKDRLIEAVNEFNHPEFFKILPTIFKVIEEKDIIHHPNWKYSEFYKISEKDSYVSEVEELKISNTNAEHWKKYIQKYEHSNKGIYYLLWNSKLKFVSRDEPEEKLSILDKELAKKILLRGITRDYGKSSDINSILRIAALYLKKNNIRFENPIDDLVDKIAEKRFFVACNEFYHLGNFLEKEKNYIDALHCYENALYLKSADYEEFYNEAWEAIKDISSQLDDENYKHFCASLGN